MLAAALLALGPDLPVVAPAYAASLRVTLGRELPARPTQIVWRGNDLYVASDGAGILRVPYSPSTGRFGAPVLAADGVRGAGVGFWNSTLLATTFDGSVVALRDEDRDKVWGESGETRVALVRRIPTGDHPVDQVQVVGNSLYIGIGTRTINGRRGAWTKGSGSDDPNDSGFWAGGTGWSWGESAWGGTLAWIRDLRRTPLTEDAADPRRGEAWDRTAIQTDARPFTESDPGRLAVHSAGTRNPFGLCMDRERRVYFTNNFNRTNTRGDGTAGPGLRGDALDDFFPNDVHDQVFRAEPGADYGYANANWRGRTPMLPTAPNGANRRNSLTFDNLFRASNFLLHRPDRPDGLGPHASANGCDFAYGENLPAALRGRLWIARWTDTVTENGGRARSLTYRDVVAVDPATGNVVRVASNFGHPIDVQAHPVTGEVFVADYAGRIWRLFGERAP